MEPRQEPEFTWCSSRLEVIWRSCLKDNSLNNLFNFFLIQDKVKTFYILISIYRKILIPL